MDNNWSWVIKKTASLASCVRAWDFLARGRAVREVGGSNPDRGTIVGGVFHRTRELARFSPRNMPYIVNSKFIYD